MRVLTIGSFEIGHTGHAAFLRKCERFGSEIIVGVNTDEFIFEYKRLWPLYDLETRMYRIGVLNPAYRVIANPSAGRETIYQVRPDLLAVGSDWLYKDYLAQIDMTPKDFDELGCGLLYLPYTVGISSSDIKARLR